MALFLAHSSLSGMYSRPAPRDSPNAHSRTPSGSFRVAIDTTSSPSTSSPTRRYGKQRASDDITWQQRISLWTSRLNARRVSVWWIVAGLTTVLVLFVWIGDEDGVFSWRSHPPDTSKVPVVDRTTLERLRLLEIHQGPDEEYQERVPTPPPPGSNAPPLVANIPEYIKPNPLAPEPLPLVPAREIDAEVCPLSENGKCSFLLAAWLGEQETKAQLHLYQLGLLALALNRTLVLPNVFKSRLSTCYTYPFSFYYSPSSLSDLGVPTISFSDFTLWAEQRDPPPSTQIVSVIGPKVGYPRGAIEIDSSSDPSLIPNKPSRSLCLKAPKTRLDFSPHSPLAIYPPEGWHRTEISRVSFGESVINTLRSPEVTTKSSRSPSDPVDPQVLAFNYELRFPILNPSLLPPSIEPPLPFSHFAYADSWNDVAASISTSLSPFIAIHWRTETLTTSNLNPCATKLIDSISELTSHYPSIKTVYLATDYPIESLEEGAIGDPVPHSGTFAKVVTDQHHKAMRNFLKGFNKRFGDRVRLTTFAKEQPVLVERGALNESLAELDPGLVGIIDKGVAMRSEVFLTGSVGKDGCGKQSSFTAQILENREAGRRRVGGDSSEEEEGEKGKLWNTVSRWGLKGLVEQE